MGVMERGFHAFLNVPGVKPYLNHRTLRIYSNSRKYYKSSIYSARSHTYKILSSGLCVLGTSIGIYSLFHSLKEASCEKLVEDVLISNPNVFDSKNLLTFNEAIEISRDLIQRVKDEHGSPGIVVGVSIDGESVWEEGFGYADVENRVPCTKSTVMRIASISKSLTMAAVGKLLEDGKLDLDKPIQEYLPEFPEKTFEDEKVTITCRHLVSHMSGIRHYEKISNKDDEKLDISMEKSDKKNKKKLENDSDLKTEKKKKEKKSRDQEYPEFYKKDNYTNVMESLDIFQHDPLVSKPGSKYHYTTHGYTLLSAVVEVVSKEKFPDHMCKLFQKLGLKETYLDKNQPIIYHRSRNYCKNEKLQLVNSPYVDNSYKWAGGGFLSTVGDLIKFGNAMLYSYQQKSEQLQESQPKSSNLISSPTIEKSALSLKEKFQNITLSKYDIRKQQNNHKESNDLLQDNSSDILKTKSYEKLLPGFLKPETVKKLWFPVIEMTSESDIGYGMGWVIASEMQNYAFCKDQRHAVFHTGGAVGASSVLLILPRKYPTTEIQNLACEVLPKGIVVSIITNMECVGLSKSALKIAKIFDKVVL